MLRSITRSRLEKVARALPEPPSPQELADRLFVRRLYRDYQQTRDFAALKIIEAISLLTDERQLVGLPAPTDSEIVSTLLAKRSLAHLSPDELSERIYALDRMYQECLLKTSKPTRGR